MAETGWSIRDVAKIKVGNRTVILPEKQSTVKINGEDQEFYLKKKNDERIGEEVKEVLREQIRIFAKKGRKGCVKTNINTAPGRVQYKDREEIKKMNKEINASKKEEILAPLKKEIVKYSSQLRKLIFILLHIKTFYALNQISSFTRKDASEFFTDIGFPIKQTSFDQIFGPTIRELLKLNYVVEENKHFRIIDPKFFEGTVEDWNEYILEKDKEHDILTKQNSGSKKLPAKKSKGKESLPLPLSKKSDESSQVVPLSGIVRAQSLISLKIEINAGSIAEFDEAMRELKRRIS